MKKFLKQSNGKVSLNLPKIYNNTLYTKSSRNSHVENMEASSFLTVHSKNLWTKCTLLRVIIDSPQNKKTEQELRLFYHEFYRNLPNKTKYIYLCG